MKTATTLTITPSGRADLPLRVTFHGPNGTYFYDTLGDRKRAKAQAHRALKRLNTNLNRRDLRRLWSL